MQRSLDERRPEMTQRRSLGTAVAIAIVLSAVIYLIYRWVERELIESILSGEILPYLTKPLLFHQMRDPETRDVDYFVLLFRGIAIRALVVANALYLIGLLCRFHLPTRQ